MRLTFIILTLMWLVTISPTTLSKASKPNIIMIMADDLGYGDTGFNGNKIIQTPNLDKMAKDGVTLRNFYSTSPVCSPTRGAFLTGRHPHRFGIFWANIGHLPKQEVTISEMLKQEGYLTGHFGKWHLGTLSRNVSAKGPERRPSENFSPPAWHGYDTSFVTESAVDLWNPGKGKRSFQNPFWLDGKALNGKDASLNGGASRVVIDKVLPFIKQASSKNSPFLAVIWFHTPHENIEAGPKYLEPYSQYGEAAHYFGAITEMDEQIGRLREYITELGISDNTLITFTSDNGPESMKVDEKRETTRRVGETGELRGRKRSLYEGGIRVPSFILWPNLIPSGKASDAVLSTLDYFPTLANLVGSDTINNMEIDGENILPILLSEKKSRTTYLPFIGRDEAALIEGNYKLLMSLRNINNTELYNIEKDPQESMDLAPNNPEKVNLLRGKLISFIESAEKSQLGSDYNDESFRPVDSWPIKMKD